MTIGNDLPSQSQNNNKYNSNKTNNNGDNTTTANNNNNSDNNNNDDNYQKLYSANYLNVRSNAPKISVNNNS